MTVTVQLFAFNTAIAKELKERITPDLFDFSKPLGKWEDGIFKMFTPSAYQARYFDWLGSSRGSCIVKAVAGSGKTTTIVYGLRYIPGVEARNVSAGTFHSVGYKAILKRLNLNRKIEADSSKVRRIAKTMLVHYEYEMYSDFSVRLVGLAKGEGIGPLVPDTEQAWQELVNHHDLFIDSDDADEARGVQIARDLLKQSNLVAQHGDIDFDDMIYLPLLWRLRLWQNDYVIIDEAQDTNRVRRAIAKLALRPGGRLIAVGDDRQAIYGFTGASHDAMDLISKEFNCTTLPLTVSYRCPKDVAALVQSNVPEFEVPETAIQGTVKDATVDEMLNVFGPHDAVLCRQTAPLIELAFALIAQSRACVVLGKEIGSGLVSLIKKQKAQGIERLQEKLEAYRARETAKHMSRGEEQKAEAINDRIACINTVIENLDENGRTIPALCAKIEGLFSDANGALTLSTMHKAKGREWRRVAILRPELIPSKWARQEWQYKQELNLDYVAKTRTLEVLYILTTPLPSRNRVEKKEVA